MLLAAVVGLTLWGAPAVALPEPGARQDAAMASKTKPQGIAVVGAGGSRDEAFLLARAVYGSSLRPRGLDELRARILAGDPAPKTATKDTRELAELRAAIAGEDAASRQLLATIARQVGVQGLLVVTVSPSTASAAPGDAGVEEAADAAAAPASATAPATVSARLFLAESADFDAARYEPDGSGWRGTVASLSARFPSSQSIAIQPQASGAPPKIAPGREGKPFYSSPWLWGALGAAALVGGFFFFATQDTSDDPIHLQMRVPR